MSCEKHQSDAQEIQEILHHQQLRADELTEQLYDILESKDYDSLCNYVHTTEDIHFYVFHDHHLVYWTDSWLSDQYIPIREDVDGWQFVEWNNAQGVGKRTYLGDLLVLTVIPIKYNYCVTNANLENGFVQPFHGEVNWNLTATKEPTADLFPVHSVTGEYLFSIDFEAEPVTSSKDISIDNFSYQAVLAAAKNDAGSSRNKLLMYYGLTLLLIFLLIASALYHLIKNKGVRNLSLAGRLQLILTPVMLLALVSTFTFSVLHIRRVFVDRQQTQLQEKASYVQKMLQNMYFWDFELNPSYSNALNVDLRDLSFEFETDIHVYDINGQLIGTSCPQIFELGIVSSHITPEVFFADDAQKLQHEQIGNVRYIAAYTEFVNGNYDKIGYIAIPSFISEEEMSADIEQFVVRLLPLYIVLLLVSIIVVWLVARRVSAPLKTISTQLKNYRLGEKGQHISYLYKDEVGNLIQHYNEMMDVLADSTERLARTEREGAWRTMARQVAHEINNPLTPMKLTLQQLQRRKGTECFDEYFDRSTELLIEQIETLGHIAQSFSSFAKMPEVNPTEVDVAKKLYALILLMRNNDAKIPIRYVGPEHGVVVETDMELITQVFTNIIRNALQAMEDVEKGDLIIILKQVQENQRLAKDLSERHQWIEISISDNGPGIPDDVKNKVFIPNFSTKNSGAGLGLAISKNIVEGSGGKITFQTSEKGTTFFVYLKKK
jgi:signal transduction histidine kinase